MLILLLPRRVKYPHVPVTRRCELVVESVPCVNVGLFGHFELVAYMYQGLVAFCAGVGRGGVVLVSSVEGARDAAVFAAREADPS